MSSPAAMAPRRLLLLLLLPARTSCPAVSETIKAEWTKTSMRLKLVENFIFFLRCVRFGSWFVLFCFVWLVGVCVLQFCFFVRRDVRDLGFDRLDLNFGQVKRIAFDK